MRYLFWLPAVFFVLLSFIPNVNAREYGHYDPREILTTTETPSGTKHGLDIKVLDKMIDDLSSHANYYPPIFDSAADKRRAANDAKMLSGMLDILVANPNTNPDLLLRSGLLNSIAHNLDMPGAAQKADRDFQKFLAQRPDDPRGNYMYGVFLGGINQAEKSLPYLKKAASFGVTDAFYSLGMVYLTLGNMELALENLKIYQQRNPNGQNVGGLIDAIKSGKVQVKHR